MLLLLCSMTNYATARAEDIRDYVRSIVGDSLADTKECSDEENLKKSLQAESKDEKSVIRANQAPLFDSSCLVPVEKVFPQWKRGSVLIVDVRKPELFQQHQISGSINLPLYEIKYKKNLKNRNIVLANKGLTQRYLLKECSQLKAKGFNYISVLKGGLNEWSDHGFPLNSKAGSVAEFDEISPYEYFNAAPETEWIYIDLDHSSAEIRSLISEARILEYNGDLSAFKVNHRKLNSIGISGRTTRFLMVDRNGKNYQKYRRLFSDLVIKDIFFLSGGITELQRYMHKHAALIERQKKGFQVRMGCN